MREVIIGCSIGVLFAFAFFFGLSLVPESRIPADPNDAIWGIKQ